MTSILITGVAGFLGSHLSDRFINEGYDVVGMDNLITGDMKNIEHLMKLKEFDNLTHYAFDMHGESVFETKFQKPAILWFGSESHGFSEEFKNLETPQGVPSKVA